MKRTITLALCAICGFAALAADWTFDGTYLSDGVWKFNATVKNTTELTVGTPVAAECPTSLTALDFSKPVKSSDGETTYTITVLNCNFRNSGDVKKYLGELTLPGEGLTTIDGSCFGECPNVTGELVFPSTLTRLRGAAFYKSTKITANAATIPAGVVEMGVQVFTSTGLYGDMRLPNLVTDDMRDTFLGTKITSVYLGPGVTGLWGADGQGPFQNCTELTNVTFDANCSVYLKAQSVFAGCTKLEEIDLRCVTTFEQNNNGHFYGCSSLKRIILGPKLVTLGARTFRGATALEEVVFLGPPPTTFQLPYLNDDNYSTLARKTVKTIVYKDNYKTYNESGFNWLDYAEGYEIHPTGSTFASDKVAVSKSLRPLIAPDLVISGDTSVSQVGDKWQVSIKVKMGEGELYVTATDPTGEAVTNLVSASAAPSDTPYVATLNGLTANKAYSLAILSKVDGLWETSAPFETIFNGQLNITKVVDADRGAGTIGLFRFSLADDAVTTDALPVAYELGEGTTAVSDSDYGAISGSATIPAGANSVLVQIIPLANGEAEDRIVELELADGKYFAGADSAQLTIIGSATFGGWVFDSTAQTMTDGTWQFAATLNGTTGVDVGLVNVDTAKGPVPTELTPLDFSKAVVGTDGKTPYTIVKLNGPFQKSTSESSAALNALRPYVGALTLPSDGLTEVGVYAFDSCSKATGENLLPSTITTLSGFAFSGCKNLIFDADKIPSGITTLGVYAFQGTGLNGDLYLPNLVGSDYRGTFMNTKLTSLRLGPWMTGSCGGYGQGFVQSCTKLTNVVFEADSVHLYYMDVFNYCSSLKELDLTMVTKLENDEGNSSYLGGFFQNSGLERVTFSSKLTKLSANVFHNATKLEEVTFLGPPPVDFREPYLKNVAQTVTTRVHRKQLAVTNSAGKCWLDYATDGVIRYKNTTFASDKISVESALRPLVTIEPDGLQLIVR